MRNKTLVFLETYKIVEYIRLSYLKTVEKVNKSYPLHFGYDCGKVNILVSFTSKVPNNSNVFSCERFQQYLVKDLTQVVEILTELGIYREESFLDLKTAYCKQAKDVNTHSFLTVTSFKPISFN